MFESCLEKQHQIKKIFASCSSKEERYDKIIELGRQLPPLDPTSIIPNNLVPGCQSLLYLETSIKDGKIYFNADSEALISKGLAALLIMAYSGENPATIIQCPPSFLTEIGLEASLSPTRSNGLSNLYLKMRQRALPYA